VSDIILCEFKGRGWLVRGERYIDDLLINALPPNISIEVITCEAESDVNDLWFREGWNPDSGRRPWMIHPAIMKRIRGSQDGQSIIFGQWSALLDDEAHAVLRGVALAADQAAGVEVCLISYSQPDQPRAMIDLTNLRCSLVEAELERLGVAPSRFVRETREAPADKTSGGQRIDIRVGAA
jgi:hypothetical protein